MSDQQSPNQGDAQGEGNSPRDDGPQSQEIRHSQVSALVPESVGRGVFSTGAVVVQGSHEFILDFLVRMASPHQVAARVVLPPAVVGRFITALGENLKNYEKKFGTPQIPTPIESIPQQPIVEQTAPSSNAGVSMPQGSSSQVVAPDHEPDYLERVGTNEVGSPSDDPPVSPAQTPSEQPQPTPPQQQQNSQTSAQDLYDQLKLPDEILSGAYANAVMIGHSATEFSFDFITTFFPRSAVACRVYLAAPNVPRLLDSLKHSFGQFQRRVQAQQGIIQQPPPSPPTE